MLRCDAMTRRGSRCQNKAVARVRTVVHDGKRVDLSHLICTSHKDQFKNIKREVRWYDRW